MLKMTFQKQYFWSVVYITKKQDGGWVSSFLPSSLASALNSHSLIFIHTVPGKSTDITLHQKCDTKFEVIDGYLKLKGKNLCLQPASRRDDPANNEEIVLDENCDKDRHSFYFDFLEGIFHLYDV